MFQAIGNPLYVPWCLEGLAGVAAARGEWARAGGCAGRAMPLKTAAPTAMVAVGEPQGLLRGAIVSVKGADSGQLFPRRWIASPSLIHGIQA
jgi:hypothetical protein